MKRCILLICTLWSVVVLRGATGAFAGTYSTSFPSTFCGPSSASVLDNNPFLESVNGTADSVHNAWFFNPITSASTGILWCDVMFPRSVITNSITIYLTWEIINTPPADAAVCWQALWEITRPGQNWGFNFGNIPSLSSVTSVSVTTEQSDIHTSITITATDMTNTPCATGTQADTCAGSHGILALVRSAPADCPNDLSDYAVITRIEVTGSTQ